MRNCVLLVGSRSFSEQALFIAHQLSRQTERGFDVVIGSAEEIDDFAGDVACRYLRLDVDPFIEKLPQAARLGPYAYWKLPAIDQLANQYERILYLDTDIFIASDGLQRIFEVDLNGAPLAAVLEKLQRERPNQYPYEFEVLGLPNGVYFNSGVMLIDGPAWRKVDAFSEITQIALSSPEALCYHDQSILNIFFRQNWLELSPFWNWQYNHRNAARTKRFGPGLIHYSGTRKVWDPYDGKIPRSHWEEYRSFQLRYGGGEEAWSGQAGLLRKAGILLRDAAQGFRSGGANRRYEKRFPHRDSTVLHRASNRC